MRESQMMAVDLDSIQSPEDILMAFQEDVNAKRHLVEEILPKDIESMRRHVASLEEIESTSLTSDFLQKIHERIKSLNRDINKIMEDKMLKDNPMDDKMSLFQQNVRSNNKRFIILALLDTFSLLF